MTSDTLTYFRILVRHSHVFVHRISKSRPCIVENGHTVTSLSTCSGSDSNGFSRRKSFIDLSTSARFGRSISTTSVAIELDQPLVADPEVMRDLVEHDMPDLAA